ncbi:MAG: glycosyltransferase family 39 protein [Deltaproteobacteria bacterium]|nr:glycosyltransferase family 39 protein [Deltaproteobacteria bacterium]
MSLTVALVVGIALVASASAAILRKLQVRMPAIVIVISGLALYGLYFSYTSWSERNPDAVSHLAYVQYVAAHRAIPSNADCSVCHHPPLYYVAAAAAYRAFQAAGSGEPALGPQMLSFLLFTGFVLMSAVAIRRLAPDGRAQDLATALVVFWPSSVLNSHRVSNDVMLYAVAAGVLLCLVRWWQKPAASMLWAASGLAVVGMFTKANGLVLSALVVAVALAGLWRSDDRRSLGRAMAPALVALLLVSALHGLIRGSRSASLPLNVLGSAYTNSAEQAIKPTLRYYCTFQPWSFVTAPYATARRFRSEEPTFWNHLLKSSLLGTHNVMPVHLPAPEPDQRLARAMNVALLAMLSWMGSGLLLGRASRSAARTFCLVATAVFVSAALVFHVFVPYGFHADFRFIFPAIVPAAVLYAHGVEDVRKRALRLWPVGFGLAGVFVLLSIAYFLPMTWTPTPHRTVVAAGAVPPASASAPAASSSPRPVLRLPRPFR